MCRGSLSPCSKYLQKEAIRQTLLAIITILTILWMPGLQASASAQTPFEQACFNAIQGKIPWSREGSTTWHPPNLETLCRGVSHYQARILCFQNGIAGHNDWRRATQECQNVGIATASEQACFNAVQNKIPWSRNGSTAWSPLNVEALCRGVDNHSARITCFQNGIAAHNDWNRATKECQSVGIAAAIQPKAPAVQAQPLPGIPRLTQPPSVGDTISAKDDLGNSLGCLSIKGQPLMSDGTINIVTHSSCDLRWVNNNNRVQTSINREAYCLDISPQKAGPGWGGQNIIAAPCHDTPSQKWQYENLKDLVSTYNGAKIFLFVDVRYGRNDVAGWSSGRFRWSASILSKPYYVPMLNGVIGQPQDDGSILYPNKDGSYVKRLPNGVLQNFSAPPGFRPFSLITQHEKSPQIKHVMQLVTTIKSGDSTVVDTNIKGFVEAFNSRGEIGDYDHPSGITMTPRGRLVFAMARGGQSHSNYGVLIYSSPNILNDSSPTWEMKEVLGWHPNSIQAVGEIVVVSHRVHDGSTTIDFFLLPTPGVSEGFQHLHYLSKDSTNNPLPGGEAVGLTYNEKEERFYLAIGDGSVTGSPMGNLSVYRTEVGESLLNSRTRFTPWGQWATYEFSNSGQGNHLVTDTEGKMYSLATLSSHDQPSNGEIAKWCGTGHFSAQFKDHLVAVPYRLPHGSTYHSTVGITQNQCITHRPSWRFGGGVAPLPDGSMVALWAGRWNVLFENLAGLIAGADSGTFGNSFVFSDDDFEYAYQILRP